MIVIGLNAYHGDASAAALVDGQLVAAVEEERFTRVKHAAGFPREALRSVVAAVGAGPKEPCVLAVARAPWARALKKALYAVRMPAAAGSRARVHGRFGAIAEEAAQTLGWPTEHLRLRRVEHHAAHLASAFFVSPFEEAALFSIDGLGDFASAMWGVGRGNRIYPAGCVTFPHSLGIFYSALTQYLGFEQYGDEYKVMGLASYGEPEYGEEFERIVLPARNGDMGFALGLEYFVHHRSGVSMTWDEGAPVIGRLYSDHLVRRLGPARPAGAPIEPRHQAIAASLQRRLENVVLDRLRALHQRTGLRRLCLAGGVAFNCVANGKIRERTGFEEVYVQSAAGDAGLAIGAAMHVWHQQLGHRRDFVMEHSYWGPSFRDDELRRALAAHRGEIERTGGAVRRCATRKSSAAGRRSAWRGGRSWGGFREGWSGARARSATAASSPTRVAPR